MKLHHHPVSTTSRAVLLFAADQGIPLELQSVDMFAGEHLRSGFAKLNPGHALPVLVDGDFRLTESASILRYLAERHASPAYPLDVRERARVNERLDWFNTGLVRDLGYGFVYPQIYPHHQRADALAQQHTLEWARTQARRWLGILDTSLIGAQGDFVCGARISLADYFGAALLATAEAVHADFGRWQHVSRWLARMKALPAWGRVNEAFEALIVAPRRRDVFVAL